MKHKVELYGRRSMGKSEAQRLIVEKYLDSGKTVVFCSKEKVELQRRKGHLTLHQILKPVQNRPVLYFDEWR